MGPLIIMVTLCNVQDVLDRIGPNANADIIASSAIVERYIDAAEGTIVAETKVNYIGNFGNVSNELKETLTLCTAAHASKEIIAFDMGNYSTRAEAITMLNVQESTFKRTLAALKDLDSQSLRSVPA